MAPRLRRGGLEQDALSKRFRRIANIGSALRRFAKRASAKRERRMAREALTKSGGQ